MSRGEDIKKLFGKSFFFVFALVCIGLIIILLIPEKKTEESSENVEGEELWLSQFEIKYEGEDGVSFRATVSREKLCEFAEEKEVNLWPFIAVLPENLDISCVCGVKTSDGSGKVCVEIKEAEINGIAIPSKVLSDIGEINLDFKRSLVYN